MMTGFKLGSDQSRWQQVRSAVNLMVLVAGLGYFVDLFHITLFGVVRINSLQALGLTGSDEVMKAGVTLYNSQMLGLMFGGVFWGIWGDKNGRYSILTVPIVIYSLGSIANLFVWDVPSYAACRFITGFGLAGELGAAITLVSESLPKEVRGIGTTIVATMGLIGSVFAGLFGQMVDWKTAYLVAGIGGFALLALRLQVLDRQLIDRKAAALPGMQQIQRGNIFMLLKKGRASKYLKCILVGLPIYYITGVMFTFAPELTKDMNIQGTVTAGNALFWGTIGLTLGDFFSGMLSQILHSRNKAIAICLLVALLGGIVYLNLDNIDVVWVHGACFVVGLAAGYWAVLVTWSAEQFGTNLRATVATTVPNFVRGAAALVVSLFAFLKGYIGIVPAASLLGGILVTMAFYSLFTLEDTFHRDLNYNED